MGYSDVIERRLEIMIERLIGDQIDFSGDPKLAEPPVGFDSTFLQGEFRGHLNGNRLGFADVLKKPISKSDLKASIKFKQLAAVIVGKSAVVNIAQYRQKQNERVRLELMNVLSMLSNPHVEPADVLPHSMIGGHIDTDDFNDLKQMLTSRLRKYLLSRIRKVDLNGSVGRAQRRIAARMLVL